MGACFLEQLSYVAKKPEFSYLQLCYLAIIDRAFYTKDYSPIDIENALTVLEKDGFELPSLQQTIDHLGAAPHKVVVVDNTSSQAIAEAYPQFLSKGMSIITPNKKAFSGTYQLWQDISSAAKTGEAYVYHESSVGAGLPIISTLTDLILAGDEITRIEGVFSGTMSYLFNSFSPVDASHKSGKWSSEVKKAKELGYTEPDPRDDLNGLDVARKLTILSRVAGLPIESATSFPIKSLIPKELESVSKASDFLEQLPRFDDEMEDLKIKAQKADKVLRFVGTIDVATKKLNVGLEQVPKSSPIAQLTGSDNIISFYTKRYGSRPLIVQGAGAGGPVTAMGVIGDLFKVVARIK